MNYKALTDEIRGQLWPSREQENLVKIHDAFFQQAIFDVVKTVPCLQQNQKDVYPHCATYFNCGMTVLPKPQGHISEIFIIDKLNPTTGKEDVTADDEWCAKVYGMAVNYCHIERYVTLCQRCSSSPSATDALASLLFGVYRIKRRYPRPTDVGFESLPKLPEGYHYPQSSTDLEGRSPAFVYALHNGNIFIAPWIQSTETVVVVYTGQKRIWNDADLVDDDPKFKQAIRLHVGHQHESSYGDTAKAQDFYGQLWGAFPGDVRGAIPMLIHECKEESRVHGCSEFGPSAARGMGKTSGAAASFYNDRQQYTATCPTGKTGTPVTVVKEAGSVPSALSVADANAQAIQQAHGEASAQLVCVVPPVTYFNVEVSRTATCPGASGGNPAATGNAVTVTVAAGKYSSTENQAAADAAAAAAAQADANSQLVCTFHNAEQTATASCPTGTTGSDVEKTIAAGTPEYDSTISQADANAKAAAAAKNQATAALVCSGSTFIIGNTPQSATKSGLCIPKIGGAPHIITITKTVPANTLQQMVTAATAAQVQAELNQQAMSLAQSQADAAYAQAFVQQCRPA